MDICNSSRKDEVGIDVTMHPFKKFDICMKTNGLLSVTFRASKCRYKRPEYSVSEVG